MVVFGPGPFLLVLVGCRDCRFTKQGSEMAGLVLDHINALMELADDQ